MGMFSIKSGDFVAVTTKTTARTPNGFGFNRSAKKGVVVEVLKTRVKIRLDGQLCSFSQASGQEIGGKRTFSLWTERHEADAIASRRRDALMASASKAHTGVIDVLYRRSDRLAAVAATSDEALSEILKICEPIHLAVTRLQEIIELGAIPAPCLSQYEQAAGRAYRPACKDSDSDSAGEQDPSA